MVRTVAFDEAGNTGNDLLNPQQPVFTLASIDLPRHVAEAIVPPGNRELHFKSARRSGPGRAAILKVLTDDRLTPATVRSFAVHKPFTVVAKMVDVLVEPLAATHDYDMYAEGGHRALSNLLFAILPTMAGTDETATLYQAFVSMCRESNLRTRSALVDSVQVAARAAGGELDRELMLLVEGVQLGAFGGGPLPDLDPAPPCLISLAHAWAADGPFEILHDSRPELGAWQLAMEPFWRQRAEPTTFVLHNGESLTYPLPIAGLTPVASHDDARIQVADVVAGALQLVMQERVGIAADPRFASRLESETPLLDWLVDAVWPTLDMDPESLDVVPGATPFLADAIAKWSRDGDTTT